MPLTENNNDSYANVLNRLKELETELIEVAKGTGLPPDYALTEIVSQVLTNDYPHTDIQIIVSSSRKTTTTKQCYETETPGMVGLKTENLRELQKQLMDKISWFLFNLNDFKSNFAV